MSARTSALASARVAGYHEDAAAFTRIVIMSRVSQAALDAAWVQGQAMKRGGVGCGCARCAVGSLA